MTLKKLFERFIKAYEERTKVFAAFVIYYQSYCRSIPRPMPEFRENPTLQPEDDWARQNAIFRTSLETQCPDIKPKRGARPLSYVCHTANNRGIVTLSNIQVKLRKEWGISFTKGSCEELKALIERFRIKVVQDKGGMKAISVADTIRFYDELNKAYLK